MKQNRGRNVNLSDNTGVHRWHMPDYASPAIDMHAHPPLDKSRTESMLAAARESGIERIILSSLGQAEMQPFPSVAEVRCCNREVCDLVDRHPGFVYGLAYVNPNHLETQAVLGETLQHPGIVGVKLWISCRDDLGRLDPVYPVLDAAVARDIPVLCHTFYRTGGNLPGELSPADVVDFSRRYPTAKLIMAHLGGQWLRGIRAVKSCPNVWVDFSGSRAYLGSVENAVNTLGAERVLFGSDAYIRHFSAMLTKVVAAQLSVAQKRRILWDNSAALFFGENN